MGIENGFSTIAWSDKDVFSIHGEGVCWAMRGLIANLEENFNRPKFGYHGEEWDEYDE